MHEKILSQSQKEIAQSLLNKFNDVFFLCGGTSIALQIGHRISIDFDLASIKTIEFQKIIQTCENAGHRVQRILTATSDELSLILHDTKMTFFHFPFQIPTSVYWQLGDMTMPDILHLASMKAYAIGRRAKWKDYVDLYFIFKNYVSVGDVIENSKKIFSGLFNERLFREQLAFFEDIDMSEDVCYIDHDVDVATIRQFLTEMAIR